MGKDRDLQEDLRNAEKEIIDREHKTRIQLTESQVRIQASNVVLRNGPKILQLSGLLNPNFQEINDIILDMTNEILTGKPSSDKK
jgi:hypothetical protein